IVREDEREPRTSDDERKGEDRSRDDAPLEHAPRRGPGLLGVARAEELADHRLRGDGERVEREREKYPDLERDLVGRDLRVTKARRDGRGHHERHEQRGGPDDEPATNAGACAHALETGPGGRGLL